MTGTDEHSEASSRHDLHRMKIRIVYKTKAFPYFGSFALRVWISEKKLLKREMISKNNDFHLAENKNIQIPGLKQ